jgi:DNA-directed RNA polymerase subunit alpha
LINDMTPRVETIHESDDYGRFQIEPLERGFGVTLANALRRVLLSSLSGAAVTSVRVDGVYHEFDTIPGVKEDTTELILNLKQLRVKSHTDQPVSLRLMASGPGIVTASDLIYPAEVEIANPELHVATLDNADSHLELELTVESGTGYLPSDGREPPALGVIPVDAIFTPVRRVNYAVDSTRVGARTDLDRLVIEVSTDGTIRPTDALAQAANLLIQHFGMIADLTRVTRPGEKPSLGAGAVPPHIAEMPIEQLDLSQRTYNCLKRSQITRVGQILERTPEELLQLRNFGQKSLHELSERLREHGLALPGAESEPGAEGAAEESEAGDEDEMSAEMLGADAIAEPEEAEEEEEAAFEAALASDELEDEDEDEEPLGHRAGRARPGRVRREADEWDAEP